MTKPPETHRHIPPDEKTISDRSFHKDLSTYPFVFVRVDTVKKPLQLAYDGAYKVLKRKLKYFILDRNGTKDYISIDRSKPAYVNPTATSAPAVRTHLPSSITLSSKDTVLPPSSPLQSSSANTLNPKDPTPDTSLPRPFYARCGQRVPSSSSLSPSPPPSLPPNSLCTLTHFRAFSLPLVSHKMIQRLKKASFHLHSLYTANSVHRVKAKCNFVISPLSIYSGLSLALAGAASESKKELVDTLRVKEKLDHGSLCKSIGDNLKSLNEGDKNKTLVQANAAFMHSGSKLLDTYMQIVKNDFDAMTKDVSSIALLIPK
nr:gag pol polyprotein [Hymenolepis microstoma]